MLHREQVTDRYLSFLVIHTELQVIDIHLHVACAGVTESRSVIGTYPSSCFAEDYRSVIYTFLRLYVLRRVQVSVIHTENAIMIDIYKEGPKGAVNNRYIAENRVLMHISAKNMSERDVSTETRSVMDISTENQSAIDTPSEKGSMVDISTENGLVTT